MEEEKKKGKGLIVVIIILSLLLVGAGGYIYYLSTKVKETNGNSVDKDIKKDSSKVTNDDEVLDVTSDEATGLLRDINHSINDYQDLDFYFSNKKITTNDIDQRTASSIALGKILRSNSGDNTKEYAFTSDELHKKISKLFGKDYKYEDKSFTDTCPKFNYDQANKWYVEEKVGCGYESGPQNIKRIAKATKNDKQLVMYVRVLFLGDSDNDYFYDYNKTQNTTYNCENIDIHTDSVISKGALYKMIFTNDGSNYTFTSSEPVNN